MPVVLCCCSSHCTQLLTGIYLCILSDRHQCNQECQCFLVQFQKYRGGAKPEFKKFKISGYDICYAFGWILVIWHPAWLALMPVSEALSRQNRLRTSKWLCENVFLLTSDNSQMSGPPEPLKDQFLLTYFSGSYRHQCGKHLTLCSRCAIYLCPFHSPRQLLYNNIPWLVSPI